MNDSRDEPCQSRDEPCQSYNYTTYCQVCGIPTNIGVKMHCGFPVYEEFVCSICGKELCKIGGETQWHIECE